MADNVSAPYAQAGATVTGAGEVRNAKGVDGVKRLGPGDYCVTFANPEFDPAKVLPSVSSLQGAMIVSYTWQSGCDKSNHSAKVLARNASGQPADSWFSIVIH
ncbi:hypothetical protein ACFVFH_19365 [Streptomyces sp. NPDC057697]|uniref:hypothetical protein n=1 Tax=Streptomyces sp. NPDC057697 TaxID=3346219 RepID=UPI0036BF900A